MLLALVIDSTHGYECVTPSDDTDLFTWGLDELVKAKKELSRVQSCLVGI